LKPHELGKNYDMGGSVQIQEDGGREEKAGTVARDFRREGGGRTQGRWTIEAVTAVHQ